MNFPTPEDSLRLLETLSESYGVEVKSWIDIQELEGKAKLVKGLIALFNNGGGRFVIGFDNDSMRPVEEGRPVSVRQAFLQDDIQAIITKFSSEPFEILVQYIPIEGKEFPVICVPAGVRVPVATKSEIKEKDKNQMILVHQNAVYIRTLNANNTISSAQPSYKDWNRIMDTCFDNREADIGRFVRRHLNESNILKLVAALKDDHSLPLKNTEIILNNCLTQGHSAYINAMVKKERETLNIGYFDFAAIVSGEMIDGLAPNAEMLKMIMLANRRFNGWPFFMVLNASQEIEKRPYVTGNGWETAIIMPKGDVFGIKHIDLWRIQINGNLYAIRAYREDFDDVWRSRRTLAIIRVLREVTDGLAETLAIVKKMVKSIENSSITFKFRWYDLQGRTLSYLYSDRLPTYLGGPSVDSMAMSSLTIPVDIPDSALADYVGIVLAPLSHKFQGFELPENVIHEEVQRVLSNR